MERRVILVRGTVQGVGFRPFVYGLAMELGLGGFVRNQVSGVSIEIEGEIPAIESFMLLLKSRLPTLAQIDEISWTAAAVIGEKLFRIEASDVGAGGQIVIAPDAATCEDCLRELFDPADRRYRYPFLNCSNCGPRLTIVTGAPYDRGRTTMAKFAMCAACRAEYEDPANRRFHAQPTACPVCGPRLLAMDADGKAIKVGDAVRWFAEAILSGKIGAMKGLGGYHLICDAGNAGAVAELRRRKHRYEKPFAVMVSDLGAARELCEIDSAEEELLVSRRRPIVLLRKRPKMSVTEAVAPGNPMLGVMLPYTPLHHLLMKEVGGRSLVMTSGNRWDEPIVIDEAEAVEVLRGICDLFLAHDRPIHVRCDDSVTRVVGGMESPIRRSRGYAPQPISLPMECALPILAVGGQLKGTFALGSGKRAILSHHMGDLDHFKAFSAFVRDVALYEELFDFKPGLIVHDLHPDYSSTRYALGRGIECFGVQHHHAHMASCMAEHGLTGPVIGVSFDGTGYGLDGVIWGGEFLVGDFREFKRAGHFRYIAMPGGEKAVREPWRMAAAHLLDAGTKCSGFRARVDPNAVRMLETMIRRKFNSPMTSSVGRLFDAVASLIGAVDRVSYEGQAAIRLEELASMTSESGLYPVEIAKLDEVWIVDTRPIILSVACEADAGVEKELMSRKFHSTMAKIVSEMCLRIFEATKIRDVVLSGGSFMNCLMTMAVCEELGRGGFVVHRQRLVPPNDGGLCLGQLMIAASKVAK